VWKFKSSRPHRFQKLTDFRGSRSPAEQLRTIAKIQRTEPLFDLVSRCSTTGAFAIPQIRWTANLSHHRCADGAEQDVSEQKLQDFRNSEPPHDALGSRSGRAAQRRRDADIDPLGYRQVKSAWQTPPAPQSMFTTHSTQVWLDVWHTNPFVQVPPVAQVLPHV
jgi:hypothetical protein